MMEKSISKELLTEIQHMHHLMGVSPTILSGDIQIIKEDEDCGCNSKTQLNESSKITSLKGVVDDVIKILDGRPNAPKFFADNIKRAANAGDGLATAILKAMSEGPWTKIDDVVELERYLVQGQMAKDFRQSFKDVLATSKNNGGYGLKMTSQVDGIPISQIIDDVFATKSFDNTYSNMLEVAIDSVKAGEGLPPTTQKWINDIPGLESKLKKTFAEVVEETGEVIEQMTKTADDLAAKKISFWLKNSDNIDVARKWSTSLGFKLGSRGEKVFTRALQFLLYFTRGPFVELSKAYSKSSKFGWKIWDVIKACLLTPGGACTTGTFILTFTRIGDYVVKYILKPLYSVAKEHCKGLSAFHIYCYIVDIVELFKGARNIIDEQIEKIEDPAIKKKIEEISDKADIEAEKVVKAIEGDKVWGCKTYGGLTAKEKHKYEQWVAAGSDPDTHKGCDE